MIAKLIRWSIINRFLVLLATVMVSAWGVYSVLMTPLDALPANLAIVRRYREAPSPLVRQIAGTPWRSGKLDTVLAGNFDLLALAHRLPAERSGGG